MSAVTRLGPGGYPVAVGVESPNVKLSAVTATGAVGTFAGSSQVSVSASLAAVTGTGAVASLTAQKSAFSNLTGVNATGAVGRFSITLIVTGKIKGHGNGKGSAGATLEVELDNTNALTGVTNNLSFSLTNPVRVGLPNIYATGAFADPDNGDYGVEIDESPHLTAVTVSGVAGTISAAPIINTDLGDVYGIGATGSPSVEIDISTALTAVFGTGATANLSFFVAGTVGLLDVFATGAVADPVNGDYGVEIDRDIQEGIGTGAVSSFGEETEIDSSVDLVDVYGTGENVDIGLEIDESPTVPQALGVTAVADFGLEVDESPSLTAVTCTGAVADTIPTIGIDLGALGDTAATGQVGVMVSTGFLASAAGVGVAGVLFSEISIDLTDVDATGAVDDFGISFAPPMFATVEIDGIENSYSASGQLSSVAIKGAEVAYSISGRRGGVTVDGNQQPNIIIGGKFG